MTKNKIPDEVKKIFAPYPEYRLVETKEGIEVDYADGLWPLSHPVDIELAAYRCNWNGEAAEHLIKADHLLWPQYIKTWNEWTERRYRAHCEGEKIITWAGGANMGKSLDAGKLATLFWLSNPSQRTVLVGSTTIVDSAGRVWGYLTNMHQVETCVDLPGTLYHSNPPKMLLSKKDTIHGMFATALVQGKKTKTISGLIGKHPKEALLVIVDEGPDVAPAFIDAVANWERAPWFQLIVIGNSSSAYDPHGLLSTPLNGWDSVDPDFDTEWPTKRGICLYFDCYKSPAIHEKDPEKKAALSKFLFTEASIAKAKEEYGEDSPLFWRFVRGFWPPEDVSKTVLTPRFVDKHKIKGKVEWSGVDPLIKLASLDPAFTADGDSCVLRFADLGIDINGRMVLDFGGEENIRYLELSATDTEPIDYQIVHQTRAFCERLGIKPENVAVDVQGVGRGLASIFEKLWAKTLHMVDMKGGCSELPVNIEGNLTAKDLYDRKTTELWFMMQRFVISEQVKGMDEKSCEQFCTRRYEWKGKKISLEIKKDYKDRMGKIDSKYKSPDEGDGAVMIIDLARHRFGFVPEAMKKDNEEKSGVRKFFDSKYAMNEGPTDEPQDFGRKDDFSHPQSWDDGFLHNEDDHGDDYL